MRLLERGPCPVSGKIEHDGNALEMMPPEPGLAGEFTGMSQPGEPLDLLVEAGRGLPVVLAPAIEVVVPGEDLPQDEADRVAVEQNVVDG